MNASVTTASAPAATTAAKAKVKKIVKKIASATASPSGVVLKRAFPSLDADGLKLVRRHLRKALRNKEAPAFRFHKIGTRWVFPTNRDVAKARETVKPYLS